MSEDATPLYDIVKELKKLNKNLEEINHTIEALIP